MSSLDTEQEIEDLLARIEKLEAQIAGAEWEAVFIEETACEIPYTFVFEGIDNDLRPVKAHRTDAAFDLRASYSKTIMPGETQKVGTGVMLALPSGFAGLILSRSGHAAAGLVVANSPGLVDSGYRGEVKVLLHNQGEELASVRKGDRIAQLLVVSLPLVQLTNVTDVAFAAMSDTDRGDTGFGASGLQ